MEVNASQTHRQTATEASPLPLPSPVVPVNRASFSPDSGTHLVPYFLPTLDDFLPSRFYKTPALSQFSYKCPYLAPDSIIHRNETASVSTDSAMSECSSRTVSESSTAILDELQTCSYDTTDCSETPSPTLSQMSAVSDGTTLTNTKKKKNQKKENRRHYRGGDGWRNTPLRCLRKIWSKHGLQKTFSFCQSHPFYEE